MNQELWQNWLDNRPSIAKEVERLSNNPLTGMSDIVRIIRNDPSLTATILRIANSPFYGMPGRCESLNMTMVVLGMREVNTLVQLISYYDFNYRSKTQPKFSELFNILMKVEGCPRHNDLDIPRPRNWFEISLSPDKEEDRQKILNWWEGKDKQLEDVKERWESLLQILKQRII
jgi:hypothetical protein